MTDDSPTNENAARAWLELASNVHQAHQCVKQHLQRAAAEQQLTGTDLLLVLHCHDAPDGKSQQVLIEQSRRSAALVSNHIDKLRARGLVAGHRNENDRRRQHWRLTPEGLQVAQRLIEVLSNTELNQSKLASSLHQLTVALDQLASHANVADPSDSGRKAA